MPIAKINLVVQRLKDKQLTGTRKPKRGGPGKGRMSDRRRVENYAKQNNGRPLTGRQIRQIGRMGLRNALLSGDPEAHAALRELVRAL